MKTNTILKGNALEQLKKLPDESINCVMTSPPYWALRDYGVDEQLGLEPTFDQYISNLCDIFDEVQRVLRKDGTCWVNLGDTYYGSGKGAGGNGKNKESFTFTEKEKRICHNCKKEFTGWKFQNFCGSACSGVDNTPRTKKGKLPDKTLTMIPQRFAIEMVNRGWILRNTIIWHKPNCMPSSVKDRFTVDFEYIFFFVKNKKYWFETQYEPVSPNSNFIGKSEGNVPYDITGNQNLGKGSRGNPQGRNKRTTWKICPKPFKESHFAVYPEELCETPLKAGCPEFVCVKCGKAKELDVEYERKDYISREDRQIATGGAITGGVGKNFPETKTKFLGYKPTCKCNAEFTGGIVLDPFFGAGTTGLVTLKQNKKFIGIELNPEYIEIANKRLKPYMEQTLLSP